MAKTVEEGFDTFHSWLTPTKTESANAKSHRASIEACLKANFGITRFFRTGSFGNGTSVSGHSDVDYLASIPRDKLKGDSDVTLRAIKSVLDSRFPNTGVYIDSPAVVVPFGTDPAETTEIVPGDFMEKDNGFCIYDIPNGNGGWMRSSPEMHNAYVDMLNNKLNKKVEPLIRFIKAWKYYNKVPISSFYLEMFIAKYVTNENVIVYSIDIKNIFEKLQSTALASISDPLGISGTIVACKNSTDRQKTLEALKEAVRKSNNARTAEYGSRSKDAFTWWDSLFDYEFPAYS